MWISQYRTILSWVHSRKLAPIAESEAALIPQTSSQNGHFSVYVFVHM